MVEVSHLSATMTPAAAGKKNMDDETHVPKQTLELCQVCCFIPSSLSTGDGSWMQIFICKIIDGVDHFWKQSIFTIMALIVMRYTLLFQGRIQEFN